jgi:hypothetical protein
MTKKTSTPIDQEFQKFWDAYGLKRDRVAAERAWRKLSKGDRRAALAGIQRYRDDCEARGIQRMYAQGYLNHRRWEDEQDAQTDLQSGCTEYKDLKSATSRITNAHTHSDGIANPAERTQDSNLPDMAIW